MAGGIPISQLLGRFIKDRAEKGKRTREAKTDTLSALDRKEFLARNPFERVNGRRPFPVRIPFRNEVEMTDADKADRARLEKELGPLSLGEYLRSKRRPEPDIIKPRR